MFRTILIFATVMSSAAFSQTIVDELKGVDPKLAKQIAGDVSEHFADPLATQVRRLHKSDVHEDSICGQANSKNQYGGYVGFKDFRYIIERRKVYFENTGCN